MADFLNDLAARRRFGMKPGLDAIRAVCAALGDPQKGLRAIHVAGTNGKGAVCAMLDACLESLGLKVGRYTSPHLVRLNERFFLGGKPVSDELLDAATSRVAATIKQSKQSNNQTIPNPADLTYFEALTAVAFLVYAEAKPDYVVLETGLGGRLDATNVCEPALCVITRIGLDHCDWLGDTVEKIAAEKAGIVKPGVPVVLGANAPAVRAVVEARAKEVGAPFFFAPDLAREEELPEGLSLAGAFNRENAVTALAALRVLLGSEKGQLGSALNDSVLDAFRHVVWPGRFQRVGSFIVDGAHNPPAARALAAALAELPGISSRSLSLVAGFCGDKDVEEVLSILAPFVSKGYAVRTNNPRSLSAEETAAKMRKAGIDAVACPSLEEAIRITRDKRITRRAPITLVCGSLFLAGEALVALGAYPWPSDRFDAAEILKV